MYELLLCMCVDANVSFIPCRKDRMHKQTAWKDTSVWLASSLPSQHVYERIRYHLHYVSMCCVNAVVNDGARNTERESNRQNILCKRTCTIVLCVCTPQES